MSTFLEMQTEVFRRMEESSSSPVFFALAQVKEAINDGLFDLADLTEVYETAENEAFTTSTYYNLSTALSNTVLSVQGVFNGTTNRWLTPTSVEELDAGWGRWEDATGNPDQFVIRGHYWLGTFPKLASASGNMNVRYSYIPSALSADGDTPTFPSEFHPALVEYACYDLLCQEREHDKAMKFYARYLEIVERLIKYNKARASYDRVNHL